MSITPGTLNEYDMMIAVSQDAINAQFQLLFDTPNSKNFDFNLLPNDIKLGYKKYDSKTKTMKDSKRGLTADIECPTVDINNIGSGGTSNRSVRIVVEITSGTLHYYDEEDLKEMDVAAHTLSWVVQIGQRNIQDLEEEAMHPNAKKAIEASLKEADHKDYLVSSLFCLFESTQVTNSFLFVDSNGKGIENDAQYNAILNSLIVTYCHMDDKDNPYILGYGVSQKIPKPMTGTPAFFPAKFYFSTTPNSANKPQASLNFCIINGDAHDDKLVDPTSNPNAGVLSTPLINVTRASNLNSDGIFAVSNALFFRYWLLPAILDKLSFSESLFEGVKMTTLSTRVSGVTDSAKATQDQSWNSDWIETGSIWTEKDRHQYSGYSTFVVTYMSKLQSQATGDIAVDAKRDLTVKVVGKVYNKLQLNCYGLLGWLDEGYLDSTTNLDFSLSITPAEDGKWSVEKATWNVPGIVTSGNHINTLAYLDALTNLFAIRKLATFLSTLSGLPASAFDGISTALNSISTNVIMPASDVYTFLGLDSDNAGNLYTHIKYKTILDGKKT